jgi:hypothetical protein
MLAKSVILEHAEPAPLLLHVSVKHTLLIHILSCNLACRRCHPSHFVGPVVRRPHIDHSVSTRVLPTDEVTLFEPPVQSLLSLTGGDVLSTRGGLGDRTTSWHSVQRTSHEAPPLHAKRHEPQRKITSSD